MYVPKMLTAPVSSPTLRQSDAARKVSVSAISEPVVSDQPRVSPSVDEDVPRNLRPSSVVPERRRRVNPAPNPVTMDKVGAVVLAGGADSNNPLTRSQARAALRFGATYRLIDFPIANCVNSKVRRVFVLTQWNSHTLNQHVNSAYPPEVFGFGEQGCVPALPRDRPTPRPEATRSCPRHPSTHPTALANLAVNPDFLFPSLPVFPVTKKTQYPLRRDERQLTPAPPRFDVPGPSMSSRPTRRSGRRAGRWAPRTAFAGICRAARSRDRASGSPRRTSSSRARRCTAWTTRT